MRIAVFSEKDVETRCQRGKVTANNLPNEGWIKGCENIQYKLSKLSQPKFVPGFGYQYPQGKRYFQLSFDYEFTSPNDRVTFAYSVPYTFTKLQNFLK